MLVTLILRFIRFVGLSLGKNTSGTISRTPARFSENQACTFYRVLSRLSCSYHGRPKPYSAAEGLEEVFQSHVTSLHEEYKAARCVLSFQDAPGGFWVPVCFRR